MCYTKPSSAYTGSPFRSSRTIFLVFLFTLTRQVSPGHISYSPVCIFLLRNTASKAHSRTTVCHLMFLLDENSHPCSLAGHTRGSVDRSRGVRSMRSTKSTFRRWGPSISRFSTSRWPRWVTTTFSPRASALQLCSLGSRARDTHSSEYPARPSGKDNWAENEGNRYDRITLPPLTPILPAPRPGRFLLPYDPTSP